MAVMVPICPTNPLVPIPEPRGMFSILKIVVAIGPVMADASVGGIHIFQFLRILGICNIEVPSP